MSYVWSVADLSYTVSSGGRTNVVGTVHWRVNKTEGDHTVSAYGSCVLPSPEILLLSGQISRKRMQLLGQKQRLELKTLRVLKQILPPSLQKKLLQQWGQGDLGKPKR